jgi:hypothetical protein
LFRPMESRNEESAAESKLSADRDSGTGCVGVTFFHM